MTKPLVVVESPAKVRTIKKYLGSDYNVAATVGHIKDLPQREMGIDVEAGFTPQYTSIPGNLSLSPWLPTGVPMRFSSKPENSGRKGPC